ncbi:MAG TPA: tryptophan halogenase family protein [Steroidobacteraceae bacterium]|nr:tryptophan halogenase family protein [Steroidobacteraceae bacterium]
MAERVQSIIIVGGGAAAWLAAAALARVLKPSFCAIGVVDAPCTAALPFSEVALPSFHRLNSLLGIDENDLIQKTRGTFRLGARFADWGRLGDRYFHTFGPIGVKLDAVPFHHYWVKLRRFEDSGSLEDYSAASVSARMSRFARPVPDRRSVLSLYSYGYHFHAELLAAYLKEYARARGVTCIERGVVDVQRRSEDGFVDALRLDDGSRIRADLYIDCVGPAGALFRQNIGDGCLDWSQWLPCDRAVGIACTGPADLAPHSESTALGSGWRWRIPLQQCIDTGYAYSSRHLSDDEAAATLLADLPGRALAEPSLLRLSPGRPARFWDKNCIALAGGNFEPLESTGLHLVQTGISRLLTLFPVCRFSPDDLEEYNRLTVQEYDRIRDFLILHFKATQRRDSPFWEQCRRMAIPDTLRAKIELFQRCGRLAMLDEEHFGEDSWHALLFGQNLDPQDYDPLADVLDVEDARAALLRMRSMIKDGVDTLPTHGQYIAEHCAAGSG